jgi:DNA-directed RNA polymerase alpha subunit
MSLLNSLEIKEITTKNQPNTSSFVFQHLPKGMGVTIGNFLRRVLLSYVSGIAPVAVKIADKNG